MIATLSGAVNMTLLILIQPHNVALVRKALYKKMNHYTQSQKMEPVKVTFRRMTTKVIIALIMTIIQTGVANMTHIISVHLLNAVAAEKV